MADLEKLTADWNAAWNSRDPDKLAAFFAPEGTYYEPEFDAPREGAACIGEVARKTWTEWPEASFEQVSLTVSAPRVVLEWRSSAKHRSGKVVNLEGVDVLEWSGDKLAAARVYYDVHSRNLALG